MWARYVPLDSSTLHPLKLAYVPVDGSAGVGGASSRGLICTHSFSRLSFWLSLTIWVTLAWGGGGGKR